MANGTPSSTSRCDRAGRGLDDMLDDLAVVEPGTGDHRVVDVRFEAVAFLEHRGDPALRPAGRAFTERALGDHRDLAVLGEVERGGQPGRAGADDEDVRRGAHAACSLTRLRNTSSRSGSRVRTSTIAKPVALDRGEDLARVAPCPCGR